MEWSGGGGREGRGWGGGGGEGGRGVVDAKLEGVRLTKGKDERRGWGRWRGSWGGGGGGDTESVGGEGRSSEDA